MRLIAYCAITIVPLIAAARGQEWQTHPPMRPLPAPSNRPLGDGPAIFIDADRGHDDNGGSLEQPLKTIARGLEMLEPGGTLVLRGGRYYEPVVLTLKATPEAPITIRGFPGELAIIDAGHREFFDNPADAWEPFADGGPEEFRSTGTFDSGGGFGRFADSMVPFQRYINFHDLRSTNELWHRGLSNRVDDPGGIYAGPGVRCDRQTGRIHIRLSHTKLAGLGENHYRGETDPRKIPLVISGRDYALRLAGARHVRIWDLVLRGASRSAISIEDCEAIELAGLTLYGSGSALRTGRVRGLTMTSCALRGHAAPWHSRGHHKDRAGSGYLAILGGQDFVIAHCELTDHHDGVLMKDVNSLDFHHNLVENFNDDGLEPGPKRSGRRLLIHENLISRCLSCFTLHGDRMPAAVEPGDGVYVYRNVVDLRRGVYKSPPTEPDESGSYLSHIGAVCGDHGGPTWPVYYIYHNTFIRPDDAWRDYYGFGWGSHMQGTTRRVMNNIFVQTEGMPGLTFQAEGGDDLICRGNMLWGMRGGAELEGDFFADFRRSKLFLASQAAAPPGWTVGDAFADPRFAALKPGPDGSIDVTLSQASPAVDSGVPLPVEWPDPYRNLDAGRPDIGAIPLKTEMFSWGRRE